MQTVSSLVNTFQKKKIFLKLDSWPTEQLRSITQEASVLSHIKSTLSHQYNTNCSYGCKQSFPLKAYMASEIGIRDLGI